MNRGEREIIYGVESRRERDGSCARETVRVIYHREVVQFERSGVEYVCVRGLGAELTYLTCRTGL